MVNRWPGLPSSIQTVGWLPTMRWRWPHLSTIWLARASFNSGRSGSFVAPSPPTPPTHWCAPSYRIDFCNGLLASCPKYLTDKLQSILRAAARLVLQLPYRSSVTDLMHQELHWLDVQSPVRYKIGLLVYKCLHGLAPRYLSDFCVPVQVASTRASLRSARFQERLLMVPRTKTKTIGPRGFFHASPTVWNSLPDDLRDPELSIGCFRNKLKTFLFTTSNANANKFFCCTLITI